jgi:hypothetical protein
MAVELRSGANTEICAQIVAREGDVLREPACSNKTRTRCYHFATQLGSIAGYGPEQRRTLEQNSAENSLLTSIRQNMK